MKECSYYKYYHRKIAAQAGSDCGMSINQVANKIPHKTRKNDSRRVERFITFTSRQKRRGIVIL